mgnify:FL=1
MSREMKRLAMKVSRELVTQRVDLGDDSYDVISDAVEGDIEVVSLADDLDFFANENGWAEFSPRDRNALAEMVQFAHLCAANPILGPVIFTGGVDGAGETRGLSEERARQIERLAVVLREAV